MLLGWALHSHAPVLDGNESYPEIEVIEETHKVHSALYQGALSPSLLFSFPSRKQEESDKRIVRG